MIGEREALEAAIVCLRDPLSRIQLAASQIGAPDCFADPVTRSIHHAVAEIDLRIEDTLNSLRREFREPSPQEDLRVAVAEVIDDLSPALGARGIDLVLKPLPDAAAYGDRSLLRRLICRMLLGIGRWMEMDPGSVELQLTTSGHGQSRLHMDAQILAPGTHRRAHDVLGPIRGFALVEDLTIDAEEDSAEGRIRVIASLPAGAQS